MAASLYGVPFQSHLDLRLLILIMLILTAVRLIGFAALVRTTHWRVEQPVPVPSSSPKLVSNTEMVQYECLCSLPLL